MLKHVLVLCIVCTAVSTDCLSRYLTAPIQSYFCQTLVYKNVSTRSYQWCFGLCISKDTCRVASYNHPQHHCLLASETCVLADSNTQCSMVNKRGNEWQHCIKWVPFSNTIGRKHGFPPHIINYNDKEETIARAVHGQDILAGWAIEYSYSAYLIGWDKSEVNKRTYEDPVVESGCSTAWVPYIIGNPMPHGVVLAGVDRDMRNKYIIRIIRNGRAFMVLLLRAMPLDIMTIMESNDLRI